MIRRQILALTVLLAVSSSFGKSDDVLRFDVRDTDLSDVSIDGGHVTLLLAPCKAVELQRLTESNIGKLMVVFFEGFELMRAKIQAPIRGGRIAVGSSNSKLLDRLSMIKNSSDNDASKMKCLAG